jgi:hypothetical protein
MYHVSPFLNSRVIFLTLMNLHGNAEYLVEVKQKKEYFTEVLQPT